MGKETEFRTLIEENRERINRICCWYVRDPEMRKDIQQEVLVNLWKSLDGFEGRSQVSTWVYRVAVNTCLGHLRSEKRRKSVFDDGVEVHPEQVEDTGACDQEKEADIAHLQACIDRLGEMDRVLVALYLEDLEIEEIGSILGLTEGHVRVKLHRVRKALKFMWERSDNGT